MIFSARAVSPRKQLVYNRTGDLSRSSHSFHLQDALLDQLSRMSVRSHSVAGQPFYQRKDEDEEERPVVRVFPFIFFAKRSSDSGAGTESRAHDNAHRYSEQESQVDQLRQLQDPPRR